jgi:uncharacterized protein YwqG
MNEAQLRAQFGAVGLSHIADRVIGVSRPAVHLCTTAQPEDQILTGVSKFGGSPDLPATLTWPTWHDKPQGFIAQVNLAEIASDDPPGILPGRGILYFFYDLWDQPAGYDPKHSGAGRVIYFDGDLAQLRRRRVPPGPHAPLYAAPFTPCAVTYFLELSSPSWFSTLIDNLALSREDQDRYADWWCDADREPVPFHQLLGLPSPIQGEMEVECQLASNGVYIDEKAWTDPQYDHLKTAAADWQLLLQVDSDDTLGTAWGADGRIYYGIRRQDLTIGDFDNTWIVRQCG